MSNESNKHPNTDPTIIPINEAVGKLLFPTTAEATSPTVGEVVGILEGIMEGKMG